MADTKTIAIENLLVNLENPRYPSRTSQRDAVITMVHEQKDKLLNLAEDIISKGLNPSKMVMVTPSEDGNTFTVLEGNRRVVALKLALLPTFLNSLDLPAKYKERFEELNR